VTGV